MIDLLENPFRQGLRQERVPEPQILTIFGASGDLTHRKLIPALYQMRLDRRLPPEITIVGVARREWTNEYFREHSRKGIEEFGNGIQDEAAWEEFAKGLYYCPGDIDKPDSYLKLKTLLGELDTERRTMGNRVYYLSVAPNFFPEAIEQIRDDILSVARRLARVDAGEITQNIEQDIVEALKEIIEALQKELEKAKDKKQQPPPQEQQEQQKQGLVNKLAELKMLRSLQYRVNRRTKQLGRLVEGEQAVDPDIVSQLKQLSDRQSKVQRATYDLSTGKNK